MNDTLQIWLLISFVIIGTYCGYRAFWYKLFQLFIGRERLDTDPKLLKARVIFDTLRIFPPAACTERHSCMSVLYRQNMEAIRQYSIPG